MASLNRVQIIGNLGKDPEVRYTANGVAMCNLSVATTHNSKNQAGERIEETEWHRVVMFNRLAEIAGEYLRKGRPVYIEGRLRTRKWQGQDGQDRYTTEIIADQMQMLGGRGDGTDSNVGGSGSQSQPTHQQSSQQSYAQQSGGRSQQPQRNYQAPSMGGMADMGGDIPFASLLARNAYCI